MIGGNVSMAKLKYHRPSGLVELKKQVRQFVQECVCMDHGLGLNDITHNVIDNLTEELFFDVVNTVHRREDVCGPNLLGDARRVDRLINKFYYKKNNYNLNLLGNDIKVKIWMGLPARISRENLILAKEKYPNYHKKYLLSTVERDLYRIEMYELVRGFTFDDMIRKENDDRGVWNGIPKSKISTERYNLVHNFKHENKNGCIMESIIAAFARFVTNEIHHTRYGRNVYYPNDCNPGNFVWNYDGTDGFPHNVVNIDYDHIAISNPKLMIHNISWQFFSRIFDKEILPDDIILKDVVNWRKTHDLFTEVEKFKQNYFELSMIEYDSEKECFDYGISISSLNNSEVLYEYVQDKIKTYKPKEEERRIHNDDGKEIIVEEAEDDME